MQTLILASSSPRRKELLENLQISFRVSSSDVDESYDPHLKPQEVVMELASRKAGHVAKQNPEAYVIGSDTVVVIDEEILGKPKDRDEAFQMLSRLSGNTHSVYTGVAIAKENEIHQFFEKTDVVFWELTDDEIDSYLNTGEPFDKAGAYGIQGFGSILVKGIVGDYFSVVGLPISRTVRELAKMGFHFRKEGK
ncbi:Maf family protein [Cytobacillus sp. Hz8]|uniref:Maf family protein n=1 Tax=Cytobacillus sp. Hz8 TaxID=3347168 RepID=UPI0035D8DBE9